MPCLTCLGSAFVAWNDHRSLAESIGCATPWKGVIHCPPIRTMGWSRGWRSESITGIRFCCIFIFISMPDLLCFSAFGTVKSTNHLPAVFLRIACFWNCVWLNTIRIGKSQLSSLDILFASTDLPITFGIRWPVWITTWETAIGHGRQTAKRTMIPYWAIRREDDIRILVVEE